MITITSYDENGVPIRVAEDNGFVQSSRPYDPERDGWLLNQLDPRRFIGSQIGAEIDFLIAEVNQLRRKVYEQEQELKTWRSIRII